MSAETTDSTADSPMEAKHVTLEGVPEIDQREAAAVVLERADQDDQHR